MMFWQGYAQSGWTLPSFASLFTGLYPFEHRVVRSPDSEDILVNSLPKYLRWHRCFKRMAIKLQLL